MIAKRYIKVCKKYFIPFYYRMVLKYSLGVVMQEGNAPWHKAKTVRAFLEKQKVKILL
jgi:hypothetical protein